MRFKMPADQEQVATGYLLLLDRFERMATRLDSQYRLPLTRIHFGWDPIVGIIPLAGDLVMAAVSLRLIGYARQLGADSPLIARMVANVLVDALLGAIPIIGTVFDLFFRANMRNMKLLLDEIEQKRRIGSP